MKKAIMYGGGNIGRGFIGALFSQSGYAVTFIDVAEPVVNALNKDHHYPVRVLSGEGYTDMVVGPVDAINGNNTDAVAQAIAEVDILATAVGVNVLKYIVPNLVAGIRRRFSTNDSPLNIIICENLMDANKVLEKMIKEQLTREEQILFDERIGLVEASIGRMVPIQTPEMQDGDPLRVCVESYGFLPVDKAAFKGKIPDIKNMMPREPFSYYLKRKLYIHNLGHAICAYLGGFAGLDYIYEAIDDAEVLLIVQNAMLESVLALSKSYQTDSESLIKHMQDLLHRFTNTALKDTCQRVGGDPKRKLSPEDRLIGAAKLCLTEEVPPVFVSVGIAAAVVRYIKENNLEQTAHQAKAVLSEVSELTADNPLLPFVLPLYEMLADGRSMTEIRRCAEKMRADTLVGIS